MTILSSSPFRIRRFILPTDRKASAAGDENQSTLVSLIDDDLRPFRSLVFGLFTFEAINLC